MLQMFVITLREGLEAFLIVAISLAYLKKTGRQALVPAVHWGIVTAVALSVTAGVLLHQGTRQSLWEGILAIVAAVLVGTLIVHMWRAGRKLKRQIEGRLEESALKTGAAAAFGVFAFTVLMITREGMETALLINMVLVQVRQAEIIIGTVGGTLAAATVAWLWAKYGDRINLARFFQVTAVFLAVFVVQLAIYGIHELSEANIFAGAERLHWATEEYGPEGFYGHLLSYALLVLPMAWLAISALLPQKRRATA